MQSEPYLAENARMALREQRSKEKMTSYKNTEIKKL
jgi:hypothetical protein